ncbi:MAG: leucine-rich repeat domain-containing protein, partial [Clostridiales bacterium]|nr:leucine-rich repeat domain-containing protein [Clostridiales bacterium]
MKKGIALLAVLTLCVSLSTAAFATGEVEDTASEVAAEAAEDIVLAVAAEATEEDDLSVSPDDSGVSDSSDATTSTTNSGYTYTLSDGAATITGYDGDGGAVTVPASLDGYPVVAIGDSAFAGCTQLTSITLSEGITSIGQWAFYGCTSLTSLTIPASVTSIGTWLTSGCTSLTEIVVEEGNSAYASVGGVLFNAALTELICCPIGYVGDYTVPDGVTAIDESAFEGCTGLTSVTLPASLITIEDSAFADCTGLV